MFRKTCGAPHEHRSIVLLEARVGRIEQLGPGYDDHVEPAGSRKIEVMPENLSNQAFSPVSPDRVAKLFRCDDPEPGPVRLCRCHEQREKAPPHALAGIEDPLELPSAPEPPALAELPGRRGPSHGGCPTRS